MSRVLLVGAVALSIAAPAAARQSAQPPGSPDPSVSVQAPAAQVSPEVLREQRVQLGNFEVFLQGALRTAVQKFGQWVQQVAPSVYVTQATNPAVHGFPIADGDLVFTVQQSELVGSQVLTLQLQRPPTRPPQGSVVSQGGLVKADPMSGPGVGPNPVPAEGCARVTLGPIDPNVKYAECVKEELINAMLDNSFMLPLRASQLLTIVDIPVDSAVQNQVYSSQSRKLILSIKGEDLKAFHDGKTTRDEVKGKIIEQRF